MQQIQVKAGQGENFTAAGLMKRYADQTPGVEFRRSYWGEPELLIEGTAYRHHHWSISGEVVTLHLLEAGRYKGINSMCLNCIRLDKDCQGTTEQVWTGCVGRVTK